MKYLHDLRVQILVRAIIAGAGIGLGTALDADDPVSAATWKAAAAAALWAAIERFTPANVLVGWFRKPTS